MILTGSLASNGKKDLLSDYDIAVFCRDLKFLSDDNWLNEIQECLVCIHDKFNFLGFVIPTRLTIFDINFKADFSFHTLEVLDYLSSAKELPEAYNIGFEILTDKDNALTKMLSPAFEGFKIQKPGSSEFQNNINEFWFEVYHEVKYLFRNDLWTAKLRDLTIKENLLQMLEWEQAAKSNWNFSPKNEGKELYDWLGENLWKELHLCFGKFEKVDSIHALQNTITLFRRTAIETANHLEYEYNYKLDDNISKFFYQLKNDEF